MLLLLFELPPLLLPLCLPCCHGLLSMQSVLLLLPLLYLLIVEYWLRGLGLLLLLPLTL